MLKVREVILIRLDMDIELGLTWSKSDLIVFRPDATTVSERSEVTSWLNNRNKEHVNRRFNYLPAKLRHWWFIIHSQPSILGPL